MTQTFTGTLVIMECYKCQCVFGITQDHHHRAKSRGMPSGKTSKGKSVK